MQFCTYYEIPASKHIISNNPWIILGLKKLTHFLRIFVGKLESNDWLIRADLSREETDSQQKMIEKNGGREGSEMMIRFP